MQTNQRAEPWDQEDCETFQDENLCNVFMEHFENLRPTDE